MNDTILQLALRELRVIAASLRLWVIFCAVVLLFAIIAPLGTDRLGLLPRFGYWLVLHAGAWFFAITFAITANVVLRHHIVSMFIRMLIGATLAALPIGLVIQCVQLLWFGEVPSLTSYLTDTALSVPLCVIFCVMTYLAMSEDRRLSSPLPLQTLTQEGTRPEIPLLARLNPGNRGALQHISVEDHYSLVRTERGRELILLRFSDALKETGTSDGMQVHRSHWVARHFVASMRQSNGKLSLILKDGTEVPVSRPNITAARGFFER